jgi:hypothetical protein
MNPPAVTRQLQVQQSAAMLARTFILGLVPVIQRLVVDAHAISPVMPKLSFGATIFLLPLVARKHWSEASLQCGKPNSLPLCFCKMRDADERQRMISATISHVWSQVVSISVPTGKPRVRAYYSYQYKHK